MAATSTAGCAPLGDPELAHDYAEIAPRLAAYYTALAVADETDEDARALAGSWTRIALNVGTEVRMYEEAERRRQERLKAMRRQSRQSRR